MIPKRPFYFLRHDETDWKLEGRYQGQSDIPLNATGIAQAHAAADRLARVPIDRIVSSPLIRALAIAAHSCREAAQAAPSGSWTRGEELRKLQRARNSGSKSPARLEAGHQSSRAILPSDADPWHEIFGRIPPVVGKWMTAHPTELLLFVGHSGVRRTARALARPALRARVKPRGPLSCRSNPRWMGPLPVAIGCDCPSTTAGRSVLTAGWIDLDSPTTGGY